MAYETGRPANVDSSQVNTRDDAAQAVREMLADLEGNPTAWENSTLPSFLDALGAVIEEISNSYANTGRRPPALDWKHVIEMLVAASGYE